MSTILGEAPAASNCEYDLIGLITCPACGLKYIGTSAQGRSRTCRYYTCFSRVRYGSHGCGSPRVPAKELDQAVFDALLALYADTDLIGDAVIAERQHRAGRHEADRAELAAVTREIEQAEAATSRYLRAFEEGSLTADLCGERVRDLKIPEEATRPVVDVVRAMEPVVPRGQRNAHRFLLITGGPLPVQPVESARPSTTAKT